MAPDVADDADGRLKNFSNWLHCICVLTFDLEIGQSLQLKYPEDAALSKDEVLNLCYLAFPDSNSGFLGDAQFHFRLRRSSSNEAPGPSNDVPAEFNSLCPPAIEVDDDFFYGFVYFRQVKDASLPRGYFQKSIVLITRLPLVNFYAHVARAIARSFFSIGPALIEAVCQEINYWDKPTPGTVLRLPLMGRVIKIRLPCRFDKAGPQEDVLGSSNDEEDSYLVPSVHEPELFQCLRSCLSHLSLLWELVLLGEPIVVMAPFPDVASSVVQSLISLIWPLSYGYDFRPYFTVQDGDFKHFVLSKQESGAPLNVILGTTNPFFIKALENWPHVLRLPKDDQKSNNRRGAGSHKVRTNMALILNDEKFGLFSKYKGYLAKNGSLMKKVMKGMHCNRPAEAQTLIIRQYFMDLTHSFLLPLEQYLANGMPLRREISPWKDPPKMKMFDVEEFLKFLHNYGMKTVTGIKGDWPGLYRAFCATNTFLKWLNGRQMEANVKLKLIHLETLCQTPLSSALATKVEVEMVDFILKLKEALHFAETHADVVSEDLRHRINGQYRTALGFVKEDLKMILERSSPSGMGSSD